MQSSGSRQSYQIGLLHFTDHKANQSMKNDRVCWIDSPNIKRGHVLLLDGSLVPFCSKCLDVCMRANVVLKKLKNRSKV